MRSGRRVPAAANATWWQVSTRLVAITMPVPSAVCGSASRCRATAHELSSGAAWPFEALGVAFALVGLAFIVYAYLRQKRVDEALARGEFAPFDVRVGLAFAVVGSLLAVATIVLIFAESS